jgi:hypothetical protein
LSNDADESPIFFDDRQATHLMACHQTQRFVQFLLRVDRDELARCDLADGRAFGRLAFRDDAN